MLASGIRECGKRSSSVDVVHHSGRKQISSTIPKCLVDLERQILQKECAKCEREFAKSYISRQRKKSTAHYGSKQFDIETLSYTLSHKLENK